MIKEARVYEFVKLDERVKSHNLVFPAKAGNGYKASAAIYKLLKSLDCGLRRNDGKSRKSTFYETIKLKSATEKAEITEEVVGFRLLDSGF